MPRVYDRKAKARVWVRDRDCLKLKCYWPRPDPGVFTQGVGYSTRKSGDAGWLCGTREARGCPDTKEYRNGAK